MKLYYSKAACSFAPHIALEELEVAHELIRVDLLKPEGEAVIEQVNPMGAVPVLVLDDGQILTEVAVILQYLADQKPAAKLAPAAGTIERVRLQEWLNFIATELHKGFGNLWGLEGLTQNAGAREEIRAAAVAELARKFDVVEKKLGSQTYLMPTGYSVADAYFFTIMSWCAFQRIDLGKWPAITALLERIRTRPAVQRTLKSEHLIHS